MTLLAIEKFLKDHTGLDATSVGPKMVSSAITYRMGESGAKSPEEYLRLLQGSSQERQALINEVMVPETWFFRDSEPFLFLASYISKEWLLAKKRRTLRVLSIPCSTGEEAYSIAMVLHNAGINLNDVSIDAVDISTKALQRAKEAIYTKNSFRADGMNAFERYFDKNAAGLRVKDLIRKSVNFIHGNLLDLTQLHGVEPYDVVFCRNLLIYFDAATQGRMIEKLHSLMVNQGLLFVGHAEAGCLKEGLFRTVMHPRTFAFRKIDVGEGAVIESSEERAFKMSAPKRRSAQTRKSKPAPLPEVIAPALEEQSGDSFEDSLEEAQQLADCGQLDEAAELCQIYLEENPDSVRAFYLLGVIHEAQGDRAHARDLFRKTLYLDPRHKEALLHLAAQAELEGDISAAKTFRNRAQKVSTSSETDKA